MKQIVLLSGGAAQGLVERLAPVFTEASGVGVRGSFGAVGLMMDRIHAGEAIDVAILSARLIDALIAEGLAITESRVDLGTVDTAIARRTGDALAPIADRDSLRAALVEADAIYVPHLSKSTAGIHLSGVFAELGIGTDIRDRVEMFPNGAAAMAALAASGAKRPIGITQSTEIRNTPGVVRIGALPPGFQLETVYSAVVLQRSGHSDDARAFLALLTGEGQASLRASLGFAPMVGDVWKLRP